jgi:hypothetical protein
MILSEPTTTLTDYIIAVVAFIFAGLLLRVGYRRQQSICWWAAAFVGVAVAAALGGTCHGFVYWLSRAWNARLWQIMMYALSFASVSMLVGTLFGCIPAKKRRWWLVGAIGKWVAVSVVLFQMPEFSWAAADYASAMAIVLVLQIKALVETSTQAAPWMIAGILVSGLAIGILSSGFTLSPSFNHNDLYHLVQLGGLGLLYQGAKHLHDRG